MQAPQQNRPDDQLLVRSVLRGDLDAFKKIISAYEKLVFSIVYKMIDQPVDREDICQEVFIKVFEKLRTFNFQSKLSTWIGNIAFNHCANFLKKKRLVHVNDFRREDSGVTADEPISEPELADSGLKPDEMLVFKEASVLLAKAIDGLSPVQRIVVGLFHQEELSLNEIVVITGLPANTVKSHLHRARTILKNKISRYG